MQASQQREIDGLTFEVSQLDVKTARAVFVRLSKLLGPALAELARGDGDSLLDLDHTVVLSAMSRLIAQASEDELEYLVQVFMKRSKFVPPEGTGLIPLVDLAFQKTGLLTMFKWLAFAIEVNYSDFLGALAAMKPPTSPNGKTSSASNSPT